MEEFLFIKQLKTLITNYASISNKANPNMVTNFGESFTWGSKYFHLNKIAPEDYC